MMPVAAGIAKTYTGTLVLAGGTQMLAVSALIKALGQPLPPVVTTSYVRDDPTANVPALAGQIGVHVTYVDPGFGDLGHAGLARYCIGEVKEGTGAGGAMYLANLMGHSPDTIRKAILATVTGLQLNNLIGLRRKPKVNNASHLRDQQLRAVQPPHPPGAAGPGH